MIEFIARRTPSCQDMARLLSESMDRALPWPMRIKVQLHLLICRGCRTYRAQLRVLRRTMRQQATTANFDVGTLSESVRDRLKESFRTKQR